MTDEPRIVQGTIGPITAEGLRRGQEAPLTFVAPPPDGRDVALADLQKRLDEQDQILDQYHKLLLEMKHAAACLSDTLNMVVDSLQDQKKN